MGRCAVDTNAINLSLVRDGSKIIGFNLFGTGQTEAESFCYSFPSAVQRGKGEVQVRGSRIIFIHKGISLDDNPEANGIWGTSPGGEFVAELSAEEASAIDKLLNGKDEYADHKIIVKPRLGFAKGFELVARK